MHQGIAVFELKMVASVSYLTSDIYSKSLGSELVTLFSLFISHLIGFMLLWGSVKLSRTPRVTSNQSDAVYNVCTLKMPIHDFK